MTFEEYWTKVEKLEMLPGMAIQQIPLSISAETKKRLMTKQPNEAAQFLNEAIDQINHGSVESLDKLLSKML